MECDIWISVKNAVYGMHQGIHIRQQKFTRGVGIPRRFSMSTNRRTANSQELR